MKSPTNKFGFIEPDGMLNGSKSKDLIIKATRMAIDIEIILLRNLLFDFIQK